MGMTLFELAQRTGRPKKTINEIIKRKAAITPDPAIQLERNYQETLARLRKMIW